MVISIIIILIILTPVIWEACIRIINPIPKMNDGIGEENAVFSCSRRTRNLLEEFIESE